LSCASGTCRLRLWRSPQGPQNTEISCEDRAILAVAGFVSFILLLGGALVTAAC
jgi:hypothetical protein